MTDAKKTAGAKRAPAARPPAKRSAAATRPASTSPARRRTAKKDGDFKQIHSVVTEDDGTRTVTAHGLILTVPAELPFAALWVMDQAEENGAGLREMLGLLKAVLGDDQAALVRDAGLSIQVGIELTSELISLVMAAKPGESSASSDS